MDWLSDWLFDWEILPNNQMTYWQINWTIRDKLIGLHTLWLAEKLTSDTLTICWTDCLSDDLTHWQIGFKTFTDCLTGDLSDGLTVFRTEYLTLCLTDLINQPNDLLAVWLNNERNWLTYILSSKLAKKLTLWLLCLADWLSEEDTVWLTDSQTG